MAIDVSDIYCRHPEDHDLEMSLLMDQERSTLRCRQHQLVRSGQESRALNHRDGPMIVIAGSGMATGGRILHHLKHRLPDPRTTVLLPGFQAADTRGRKLEEGATQVRIHGRSVPVRATIVTLDGLSAHADRDEILRWLGGFIRPPRETWVVHGEPPAAQALADAIRTRLGWRVAVAEDGATAALRA
jgi:metallo-beta-lactamase family protein